MFELTENVRKLLENKFSIEQLNDDDIRINSLIISILFTKRQNRNNKGNIFETKSV